MKILLLEDDVILSEIIQEYLQELGFEVVLVYDGESALDVACKESFDIFVFDVNVPHISGFELLESIRESSNNTPAIFITSLNQPKDMQKAFRLGGDDYIKKPFELYELGLRIENIKKHFNLESSSIKIDDDITFDVESMSIKSYKGAVKLSPKESKLLKYLVDNRSRVISIEEIASNIYSYEDSPSDATIRTYIKNLRKALGSEYITNIKGVGYRFNKE
jgi:DNA-binding response OmpR family regulator